MVLLPPGWPRPKGYANGIKAAVGETIYVAGMIGWDEQGIFADDFLGQLSQSLSNTLAVLEQAKAVSSHIVRMNWYVKDLHAYRANLKAVGAIYRDVIGKHYPVMSVVGVLDLVEPQALLEIETTAVIPV